MAKVVKAKKKKIIRHVDSGRMYVQSTFNNTIITITDSMGNVISQASAGSSGFKGTRKSTPYAAQTAARIAIEKAKETGIKSIDVFINGVGSGRDSSVRALHNTNISVNTIKDITPVPHNGCRPKKARRV